ncbi:glycyl-tRNA synthetase [Nemania sp. NC0429]|nr:glycyl-tRNA synthetase [Nemania sp. NC0429]
MRVLRIVSRPLLVGRRSHHHPYHIQQPRPTTAPTLSFASCPPPASVRLAIRRYASSSSSSAAGVTTLTGKPLNRTALDTMLRQRLFYTPSFEIYGGVSGLFDLGPPGCALQQAIVDVWRKHFIFEEHMFELDCTALTPEKVLEASGHVHKFTDIMCKDPKNGERFRADHFVEESLRHRLRSNELTSQRAKVESEEEAQRLKGLPVYLLPDERVQEYEEILARIDQYSKEELGELIKKYDIKNPATGVQPSTPENANLMFPTSFGPGRAFLRPETAQGQFMNFSKLLSFNNQHMPFASASIGKAYRNEVSPKAGLLRVREFLMAEIEHYVDPEGGKKHRRFDEVKDIILPLLDREAQLSGTTDVRTVTIGQAVADGTVDNETLGYFLARTHLFLKKIGIDETKIRFRQHTANQMAHYATDCWDAELLTSYGWIECVGCADRSAYDLSAHAKKTGAPLVVREIRAEPTEIVEWELDLNYKIFGPMFKKAGRFVADVLNATTQSQKREFAKAIYEKGGFALDVPALRDGEVHVPDAVDLGGGMVYVHGDLVTIERRARTETVREYMPGVIEPSFGIGRILYALIEHSYWIRDGRAQDNEVRNVLSFSPLVAPTKVVILPLSHHDFFQPFCDQISKRLRNIGVFNRIDDTRGSIGRRYSRSDELGTPFGVTIDFHTIDDKTFTLRDRDSSRQVRGDEDQIVAAISSLVDGTKTWQDIEAELPAFLGQTILKHTPSVSSDANTDVEATTDAEADANGGPDANGENRPPYT